MPFEINLASSLVKPIQTTNPNGFGEESSQNPIGNDHIRRDPSGVELKLGHESTQGILLNVLNYL